MPDATPPARYRFRKAVAQFVFLIGLIALGFVFQVPIFLTAFVCPPIAVALAVIAVGRLRDTWPNPTTAALCMEWAARALLYADVPNAVLVLMLCASGFGKDGDPILHDFRAWLWVAALITPQLLWFPKARASRWAVLALALVSLAASAEFWYEIKTTPKW